MLQFCSINCNFLHFLAIICNSVQLLAILCNNLQFRAIAFNFLQYLAEYCATSCNLPITCNYILLFASSRSWILLNLVKKELYKYEVKQAKKQFLTLHSNKDVIIYEWLLSIPHFSVLLSTKKEINHFH